MIPTDAALPGILSAEEIAARLGVAGPGPFTVGVRPRITLGAQPSAPVPAPEPDEPPDDRPMELLAAEQETTRAVVNDLLEQRLRLAERIESLDRTIEEGRAASFDPETTRAARDERTRLAAEEAELSTLTERANARHDRASQALGRRRTADRAAEYRAEIAALAALAAQSDLAIDGAVRALDSLLAARVAMVADAVAVADGLNTLPEPFWIGPAAWIGTTRQPNRGWVPPGIAFDRSRIPTLAGRPRRVTLGL